MIAEFVKLLLDTGKSARTTEVKEFPNDPDRRLLFKADGTHETIETPRQHAKRAHKVATVADFVQARAALLPKEAGESAADKVPSPVWFDARRVIVYPDDRFRDESILLELPASSQLELLAQWDREPKRYDQRSFVRLLRHDLAGCVLPEVLEAFRTLSFQRSQNSSRTIQHGNESFDSDLKAKVAGETEKPNNFQIELPLFNHLDFRTIKFAVRATVDIDVENSQIVVQLLPGEYRTALEVSIGAVRTRLAIELEGTTLIAGTP